MKISRIFALFMACLLAAPTLALAPGNGPENEEAAHPEAKPFHKSADASEAVNAALAKAVETDKRVIVVMGANWCHDSRGLAGWFEQPKFAKMLKAKYHVVYVDVGYRDRNLDIAKRFGINKIKGTPTVLVLSPRGALLNRKSAPTWRNAASRKEAEIFDYFNDFMLEI